ncbi:hypothetical protein [Paenibacillus sp. NPDC058177]|uniref:AlkZ-related protein n=1 Tax=Paenibacillus sp. NPDC058177 TaxID=3346369 RepID=UPI0036DA3738
MENAEDHSMITTFEDATDLLKKVGILPLAFLIPEHPSLNGVTKTENWHSDTELDPWKWRVKFPGEGLAGYGKFIKKKAVLVSREWFPAYVAAAGSGLPLEERYNNGLSSREALKLLQIIREQQGIETRKLRADAGMKAKENKTSFDNAVTELQGSLDIVISGVKERVNAEGEKNGWNSTSYETVAHWMEENGIAPFKGNREEAIQWLHSRMAEAWTPAAIAWMNKTMSW